MKIATFVLALVAAGLSSTSLMAQTRHHYHGPSCAELYRAGYHANVDWPRSFIPPARKTVCDTYAVMIENGWRRQNLIGDYYFENDSSELTQAGKLKVRWILTQAPPERRHIFVERGMSQGETEQRIAAVQQWVGDIADGPGAMSIMDTHIVSEGHSAHVVDSTFVKFHENRPIPKLMQATQTGSGGSGGGQ